MKVAAGSPAEEAGIRSGDLLIAIDGAAATGIDDLMRLLDHEKVGSDVKVTLLRRGELRERYVVPVERR
jgi:S1-C subfamily serine protease